MSETLNPKHEVWKQRVDAIVDPLVLATQPITP